VDPSAAFAGTNFEIPAAPFVYQQSTLVDPNVNYWLGSVAMDKIGNLALGFSVSSHNAFPSIYVAARAPSDPAGALSGPLVLVNGSGVQVNSFRPLGRLQLHVG